ncbi:MAG TPA: DNA mismatch repair protein MutS [bacterium]|nr:DNA mismatch repair protein MutS [bacterium]
MTKVKQNKGATPVMRQFFSVKAQYPDAIVLFRMGDFYETFEEDAKKTARILNINLTKRKNGKASSVPLAGFPYHSLNNYLHKLLNAGYKVAICEQVEDPKKAKTVVKREVVEVVTPGTAMSGKYLENNKNNYLISVQFHRKDAGISAIDVSTGEFILTEVHKDRVKEKVMAFGPSEIICPEKYKDEIYELFSRTVLRITPLPDWMYEYDEAYQRLTEHFEVSNLKGFGCENAGLGIGSAGAILNYLQENYQNNLSHIPKIQWESDDDILGLDEFTQKNLEITRTMQGGSKEGTLLNVINETVSPMGSRLLKKWLIRPLRRISEINSRLDKVGFYFQDREERSRIREILKECGDIERLLAKLSADRANAKDISLLGYSLKLLPDIVANIKNEAIFEDIMEQVDFLEEAIELIDESLKDEEDLPVSIREGGFIADGYNEQLDEYRSLVKNSKDWIAQMQKTERENLDISSLKVGYNKVHGYYIEVTKTHTDKVPDNYIRKQTLVNSERYITEDLKEYEEKLLSAEDKIGDLEYELFQEIREKLLVHIEAIQKDAAAVAQLDVFSSLAELAEEKDYCKPEVKNDTEIRIKEGRHPVVEDLMPAGEKFVTNDLHIDNLRKQIFIITGPNMSGKSTYLRQIGLIVLMAQMGSFVPASKAIIGVVDKIFTRVGASDNLAAGESTFMTEMIEAANILNNATNQSLVLLDEIGRGTSTYDGMALAWAITEYLHNNDKTAAKTLFATHYHELTELEKILPRVINYNVSVKEYGDEIVFMRKVVPGACDQSYGVHVARMAGLPKKIIHRSNEILNNLSSSEKALPVDGENFRQLDDNPNQIDLFSQKDEEAEKLKKEIESVEIDHMTPMQALKKLDQLKKDYSSEQ